MKYASERDALAAILYAVGSSNQIESLKLYAAAKAICDVILVDLRDQKERGFAENIYPIEKFTALIVSLRCAVIPQQHKNPNAYLTDAKHYLNSLHSHYDVPDD